MTVPAPENRLPSQPSVTRSHQRVKLARKWANLISSTEYVSLQRAEFEEQLENLVDGLVDALRAEPFTPDAAVQHGARLVEFGCTGPSSLQRSLDVLGRGLLALPELVGIARFTEKVVLLIGALAAGYTEAIRFATLSQQETMSQSLLKALNDAHRNGRVLEAELEHMMSNSANGIAFTERDGRFIRPTDRFAEIVGYTVDELLGLTLFDLARPEDTAELHGAYDMLLDGSAHQVQHEQMLLSKDGVGAWVSLTLSAPRPGGAADQFLTVLEDRTELHLLHGQLNHQALHDMLTRLPNRQYFTSNLERTLRHADPAFGVTLYHLDLDAFSLITHGLDRRAGDLLLEHVAQRLQILFAGEKAMVARFGADEFAVLVENSPGTPDAVTTVRRINEELSEPMYVDGHGIASPASIGVVDRPPAGLSAAALLEAAEMTLARAKRHGRTQWALYDPFEDARDRESFGLAASLPGAWENGQLSVVHRPLVRLGEDRVVGLDALLSWDHPEHGRLAHERCAELAEQTGLVAPLGGWLLRSACEQAGEDDHGLPLHVGLTPNQASDPDLMGQVLGILNDTGLAPGRLWLGVPASALATAGEAADNVRLLAAAGVESEIHEFGTAAGDFAHLEDLPVRAVRIAGWLVRRQAERGDQESLVTSALREVLAIVHRAGATVIVDGVDSAEQARWWRHVGADLAQGEFFTPSA
jgi:diguanylate cyclase (GGDEF)-like protein/PAS domain S-box-containing protein